MVDFNKMRNQPREIDYLVYIKDEHWESLNDWERKFVPSVIGQIRSGPPGTLQTTSAKQYDIIMKMVMKFNLRDDEYCVRGYADQLTEAKPVEAPKHKTGFDDYDDDIPF